jgi:hypothetical protein
VRPNDAKAGLPGLELNKACAATDLTPAARVLHRLVLDTFAETRPARARSDLEWTVRDRGIDSSSALSELSTRDVIAFDERGEIRAAYPFSPVPTRHRDMWQGGTGA